MYAYVVNLNNKISTHFTSKKNEFVQDGRGITIPDMKTVAND